jgi:protein-disulfide isomerase/uncharacterized membrane protein
MTRPRATLALLLALLGAALSWVLLEAHHGEGGTASALCGETSAGPSGCDVVNRSSYAAVAGLPLAAAGLAFYLCLALLLLLGLLANGELLAGTGFVAFALLCFALGIDAALLAVQAFVLKAYCKLCLATYGLNVAALVALLPARRARAAAAAASSWPAGRAVLGSWLAGSLAFAVAALALHAALAARAAQRQATLLGAPPTMSPAPAPGASTPVPEPGATPASDAERYKAEAARLQAILDDPQKLDQYFSEKAARDFANAKVQKIDLAGVPMKGPATAPVTAVEYSDFLCPFCRNLAGALAGYLPRSGNRVNLYFKNYPLDKDCNPNMKQTVHQGACNLALGAVCANQQGKFWPYHDRVFQQPPQAPSLSDVERLGAEAGVDAGAFKQCLASSDAKQRLQGQIAEAVAVGVEATPTVFLNGKKLPRINDFGQVVDQEAAKQGVPPPSAPAR